MFFLAFLHTLTVRWATEEQPACEICVSLSQYILLWNRWRQKIRAATGKPSFTWKIAAKWQGSPWMIVQATTSTLSITVLLIVLSTRMFQQRPIVAFTWNQHQSCHIGYHHSNFVQTVCLHTHLIQPFTLSEVACAISEWLPRKAERQSLTQQTS